MYVDPDWLLAGTEALNQCWQPANHCGPHSASDHRADAPPLVGRKRRAEVFRIAARSDVRTASCLGAGGQGAGPVSSVAAAVTEQLTDGNFEGKVLERAGLLDVDLCTVVRALRRSANFEQHESAVGHRFAG